jgi:hypothetical protein
MQDSAYELPRIPIPGTSVNKGKEEGGCPHQGASTPLRLPDNLGNPSEFRIVRY